MTSRGKSRLQAAEMWILRSVIGLTRLHKIINDYLRNKLHIESLQLLTNTERTGETTYNAWLKIEFPYKLFNLNFRKYEAVDGP
jgi:hypothetical protein